MNYVQTEVAISLTKLKKMSIEYQTEIANLLLMLTLPSPLLPMPYLTLFLLYV